MWRAVVFSNDAIRPSCDIKTSFTSARNSDSPSDWYRAEQNASRSRRRVDGAGGIPPSTSCGKVNNYFSQLVGPIVDEVMSSLSSSYRRERSRIDRIDGRQRLSRTAERRGGSWDVGTSASGFFHSDHRLFELFETFIVA